MDFAQIFTRAKNIAFLDDMTMQKVADDKEALKPALMVMGLSSVVVPLSLMLMPRSAGSIVYRPELTEVVFQAVIGFLLTLLVTYALGYVAQRFFGSKMSPQSYVQIMGHASAVHLLGLIPLLGPIVGIWSLVIVFTVFSRVGKMGAGAIVLMLVAQALLMGALGLYASGLNF